MKKPVYQLFVFSVILICTWMVTYNENVNHFIWNQRPQQLLRFNESPSQYRSDLYVTFPMRTTGNGLGNYMFYFSGAVYVATMTGRRVAILSTTPTLLDEVFSLHGVDRFKNLAPYCTVRETTCMAYDRRLEKPTSDNETWCVHNRTILLSGAHNSWKYTMSTDDRLRQYFQFRPELIRFAEIFKSTPEEFNAQKLFVRVGIHVRRGDFLAAGYSKQGFTVASSMYFQRAMNYFVERFHRVQFIVCSNDIKWCKANIRRELLQNVNNTQRNVDIVYSDGHSKGHDLALLASCDHVIMSVGTYSWWAAWLANGITIYCTDFPRPLSYLARRCGNVSDWEYYHPSWIGMSGL